jgi:transposase
MKKLLLEMKNVVGTYKSDDKTELSRYYRQKFKKLYDLALEKGRAEITSSLTKKKSKAENLFVRLKEYQTEITRFSEDFNVPFDNNQAERDIRNNKIKQKVTSGFRTESGAEDFVKTSSVIGTVVKFGNSVVNTVKAIFSGNFTRFA